MKKKCRFTVSFTVMCVLALLSAFGAEMPASSGAIVPGVWNSHFYAGKAYAEANNVPMLLFWANPGCGNCAKMISAVSTAEFKSWMATSGLVFVFSEGVSSSENADAKAFAKNSSKKFPYMSVYYPTSSGWKKNNFSGLSSYMPSQTGSGLGGKLINSVTAIVNGSAGGGTSTSGIPSDWQRARKVSLSIDDANGWCQGRAEVSFGKAKSSTGVATVKATLELFSGKKIKFSGKATASSNPFSLTKSGYTLVLTSSNFAVSGSLSGSAGNFSLRSGVFGGAVSVNRFSLIDPPTVQGANPVLTQFLGDVAISVTGGKWKLPAAGTVRWNAASGTFESTSSANPAALKLNYKSGTGIFTGQMFIYVQTGNQKVKKLKAKINGCVVDGVGYGGMTCSGLSPMKVLVTAK